MNWHVPVGLWSVKNQKTKIIFWWKDFGKYFVQSFKLFSSGKIWREKRIMWNYRPRQFCSSSWDISHTLLPRILHTFRKKGKWIKDVAQKWKTTSWKKYSWRQPDKSRSFYVFSQHVICYTGSEGILTSITKDYFSSRRSGSATRILVLGGQVCEANNPSALALG